MLYFDDDKALVSECRNTLTEIEKAYQESLTIKEIKPLLLIKIKNFMENLRSALDFSDHGLFDKYGDKSNAGENIYFPYAWDGLDMNGFRAKNRVEKCIQGLNTSRLDIVSKIKSYQYVGGDK